MEMYQIRYFLAVSQYLNFRRAAEECHVSGPALTRAIRKLEDELDGKLFRRERNRTHLTDPGALIRPRLKGNWQKRRAQKSAQSSFSGDLLWVGNEQTQAGKGDYPIARGSNPAHRYQSPTLHLSRRGFRPTLVGDGLSISSVTDVLNPPLPITNHRSLRSRRSRRSRRSILSAAC